MSMFESVKAEKTNQFLFYLLSTFSLFPTEIQLSMSSPEEKYSGGDPCWGVTCRSHRNMPLPPGSSDTVGAGQVIHIRAPRSTSPPPSYSEEVISSWAAAGLAAAAESLGVSQHPLHVHEHPQPYSSRQQYQRQQQQQEEEEEAAPRHPRQHLLRHRPCRSQQQQLYVQCSQHGVTPQNNTCNCQDLRSVNYSKYQYNASTLHVTGVACTADGDIAMTDQENKKIIIIGKRNDPKSTIICDEQIEDLCYMPDGHLAVTLHGSGPGIINKYTSEGKLVRTITRQDESTPFKPNGIAINGQGDYILTSVKSHTVMTIKENGDHIRTFGGPGITDNKFCGPMYVTVNQKNDIIVSDTGNNFIKVFSADGKFKFKFGGKGSTKGCLRMPAPVLFLSSEFSNFWICYTLWDKTKGNIKRNSLFGRYFVLETNL